MSATKPNGIRVSRPEGFPVCALAACALAVTALGSVAPAASASDIQANRSFMEWPAITNTMRPWTYWWWPGSAVDTTNLTRQLERFRDAGLGGVHIIPIYGVRGAESNYISYLSPRWMEMLGYTVREAARLGLGVDMTTGTGWCFGGPQVSDQDANATVVVRTYRLGPCEKLVGKFDRKTTQALVAFGPEGQKIDLTDSITTEGDVSFSAPGNFEGTNATAVKTWTVYAISQKPSGQKVKRPAPGGEGWMLNLIYPDAMDRFLQPFTEAFANYTGPKPRAQYHDSYEYRSDWSPDFFAQFEKRRGYKLQNELPALFGAATNEHAARVRCDYRKTVSEIMVEESLPKWVRWSHAHGFITRNQAHGSPGNWLDLYALADIPETEMFRADRNKLISKFASSAAHVTGKRLVSAETGTWLAEHFTETLAELKQLADDMFLSGVNHIFYHGCCYSPDEAPWPGWLFYASTQMNPRNSIWRDVRALNDYITRVQSILQSGRPDNEVLLYWPIEDFWMQPGDKLLPQLTIHARDWFEGQPIGRVAKELWDGGYAFDYVSDTQLKQAKVVNGRIQTPGGFEYDAVLVPKCKYIPLETFKQLLSLAQKGGRVVFESQLPEDISGLVSVEKREEFKRLVEQISFQSVSAGPRKGDMARIGEGYFVKGDPKPALLINAVGPQSALASAGLGFIRREVFGYGGSCYNYFIANRSGTNFDGWIPFFNPSYNNKMSAVLLDPMTGTTGVAAIRQNRLAEKIKEIRLQLHAGQTVILRTFHGEEVEGPAWTYCQTDGEPFEIKGTWRVKFIAGGPELPAAFETSRLASWTELGDTNAQRFAGTALYTVRFDAPARAADFWFLDLGRVCESARVRINGRDLGALICPPFRVVADDLKPEDNLLEVEVTNLSANRIRDLDRRGVHWKIFRDINFVNINYKPFDASNWPLRDSGLLGPVRLVPAKRLVPTQN